MDFGDGIALLALLLSGISLSKAFRTSKRQLISDVRLAASTVVNLSIEATRLRAERFEATSETLDGHLQESAEIGSIQNSARTAIEEGIDDLTTDALTGLYDRFKGDEQNLSRIVRRYR